MCFQNSTVILPKPTSTFDNTSRMDKERHIKHYTTSIPKTLSTFSQTGNIKMHQRIKKGIG